MDVKKVRFYFDGGYKESEIVNKGFSLSEIYYNKLQAADGSAKLSIPFNIEIANLLKAEINQRVKAELFNSSKKVIYTGYLKQDVAFQKGQRNEPITLTIVSPSFYLDKELPRNIAVVNQSVNMIIQKVLTEIGFEEGIKNTGLNEFLPFFSAEKGESAKTILAELCYEFGYVYYFDNLGRFSVRELFDDMPRDTKSIKTVIDGKVLLDKLKIQAKEHEADYVRATWQQVESFQNTLVFSDTQGAEGNDKCRIKINSGWSMFATEEDGQGFLKINYCDFDSTKGKVLYVDGIISDVVFDSGIDWNVTDIDTDGSRLCAKAIVTALNKSSKELYCRKLDIYAKQAYIATSTNVCVSTTGNTAKEVELKYLYKKTQAEKFTERLANYYRYCNFTITAKSVKDYELGSFVKVEEYGTGTFYGRIIQKQYSLEKNAIEYKIETITDFTPATVDTTGKSNAVNAASALRGEKGDAGRSGQDGATPYCYLEQASVTFSVDDVGKVEGIKYRIPIHCLVDNVELPFTIGKIEQKDGIKITPYEVKDEYNHVVERGIDVETVKDYLLTAGGVTIPIIFTEVEHSYAYGDADERIVVGVLDELLAYGEVALESADSIVDYKLPFQWAVQRLAIYRGAKKSIDGFLSPDTKVNLHRGDWFTWAGANHTKAVYNGVTVDFCTGGVYKWNGEYWEKDESVEHLSAALTDVLSVNDAMLKANNDKMELLLEKLANQQAFLDDLNNSVLPSMLANNATLGKELSEAKTFYKELEKNTTYLKDFAGLTTFTDTLAANTTFTDKLVANEAYIKKLVADNAFVENLIADYVSANSGVFKKVFLDALIGNKAFLQEIASDKAFVQQLIATTINADTATMASAFIGALTANEAMMKSIATDKEFAKYFMSNKLVMKADPTDANLDGSMRSETFDNTNHTAGWEIKQNGDATFYNMTAVGGTFKDISAIEGNFYKGTFKHATIDKTSEFNGKVIMSGDTSIGELIHLEANGACAGVPIRYYPNNIMGGDTTWEGLDYENSWIEINGSKLHFCAIQVSESYESRKRPKATDLSHKEYRLNSRFYIKDTENSDWREIYHGGQSGWHSSKSSWWWEHNVQIQYKAKENVPIFVLKNLLTADELNAPKGKKKYGNGLVYLDGDTLKVITNSSAQQQIAEPEEDSSRQEMIEDILAYSTQYTEEELEAKTDDELLALIEELFGTESSQDEN